MRIIHLAGKTIGLAILLLPLSVTSVEAKPSAKNQKVIDHWTPARMQQAIPRQLVIAANGQGYLKRPDGSLQPHGHNQLVEVSKASPQPRAKPGTGGGDSDGPVFSNRDPQDGATIDASHTFSATVSDPSGVRSVSLVISLPDGGSQSFSMSNAGGDVWESTISGFTDGDGWAWHMEAKDETKGKGNTSVSDPFFFEVVTGGEPPPPGGDVITNSPWDLGGLVQTTVGRIYFEMPTNARLKRWAGYVCSGTVATDGTDGRAVIITAAHCAYDDANKAFARNVLFIPNQDGTTGSGTDTNCSNDPLGCWTPAFAVVDTDWTTTTFPNNIPWDYAYYVVSDTDAHSGNGDGGSLESVAGSLPISFASPARDVGTTQADADFTHGIGYSYADDPNLMFCAENMTTEGVDNWWLPSCGLSGGSSGGPWIQPLDGVSLDGPIISVNSWGYNGEPGMAGPRLDVTSASCLFDAAKTEDLGLASNPDGRQGVIEPCP